MRRSAWPMLKIVITRPDCWLRSSLALSSSRTNLHVIIIHIFQTSLRNILGTKNLHEILSDRESIALAMQVVKMIWKDDVGDQHMMCLHRRNDVKNVFQLELVSLLRLIFLYLYLYLQGILDDATVAWGIKVERVEM